MLAKHNAMGPFLEAAFIPMEHRLHCFLQKAEVLILRKMVWLFAGAACMTELKPKAYGSQPWKNAEQQVDFGLPMSSVMDRRAALLKGYSISGGFVDPMFLPEPIRKAANMREKILGLERSAILDLLSLTFPGEVA